MRPGWMRQAAWGCGYACASWERGSGAHAPWWATGFAAASMWEGWRPSGAEGVADARSARSRRAARSSNDGSVVMRSARV
eukprot:352361-Chlamydomonas_euryale.AAC.6